MNVLNSSEVVRGGVCVCVCVRSDGEGEEREGETLIEPAVTPWNISLYGKI